MTNYHGFRQPLSDLYALASGTIHHQDGEAQPGLLAKPLLHLRRASPCPVLLAPTIHWIASLPETARAVTLDAKFARIANNICALWNEPTACREYLAELASDLRGGRRGFPPEVMRDVEALREYFEELHPLSEADATWGASGPVGIDRR